MIVYPENWHKDYSNFAEYYEVDLGLFYHLLTMSLSQFEVKHLAYSGGIDSTILLDIMTILFEGDVHTYIIASREDHPDVLFARKASKFYNTNHHEFIVAPTTHSTDKFQGDNAVRQFFEKLNDYTDKIICGDGIDEFMCGYYDHMSRSIHTSRSMDTYKFYLGKLCANHLIPLNNNSKNTQVFLPYLDNLLIDFYRKIPLSQKVSDIERKKVMTDMANFLKIPEYIINRNKYGFCDAFIDNDK